MKKVELHVHLDGSVRPSTVAEILNVSIVDAKKNMIGKNSKSLNEYLKKFDYPNKAMQKKENITRITRELLEDLVKDDCVYAEIRFAPILHTKLGLTLEEVVNAVIDGLDNNKIIANIILCMMRGFSFSDNLKIIDLYKKNISKKIVGLDLAGDEYNYPNKMYVDLFKIINDEKIPFTIHSGEALSNVSVDEALTLGAKRIGHGVRSIESIDTVNNLIKNNCLLEICPTSNVDTFTYKNIKESPIYRLYSMGVNVCINTDNRTVSDTTLENEYKAVIDNFDFKLEDLKKMNICALKNSFIAHDDYDKALKLLLEDNYEEKI